MNHLVGKEIYLRGTGNNARSGKGRQIESAKVIACKKVFVTIQMNGAAFERKFRMLNRNGKWHLSSEHNSGYEVFESPAAFNDQIEVERLALVVAERCRFPSHLYDVPREKLAEVARLLGVSGA